MNGLYDLLGGIGNSISTGVSDLGTGLLDLFGGNTPQVGGMTMANGQDALSAGVDMLKSGGPNVGANPLMAAAETLAPQPLMTAAAPVDLQTPGLMDSLTKAGKDWATGGTVLEDLSMVGKMGGGLYDAMLKGKLVDEQLKTAKQNRQFAADEQQRGRDFRGTTASTFGGGNSSNYYSA